MEWGWSTLVNEWRYCTLTILYLWRIRLVLLFSSIYWKLLATVQNITNEGTAKPILRVELDSGYWRIILIHFQWFGFLRWWPETNGLVDVSHGLVIVRTKDTSQYFVAQIQTVGDNFVVRFPKKQIKTDIFIKEEDQPYNIVLEVTVPKLRIQPQPGVDLNQDSVCLSELTLRLNKQTL